MNYLWGPVQLQIACLMFMFTVNRNRVCFRRAAAGILATSVMYFFLPLQKWATDYPRWQIFWVAFFQFASFIFTFACNAAGSRRCTAPPAHWPRSTYFAVLD